MKKKSIMCILTLLTITFLFSLEAFGGAPSIAHEYQKLDYCDYSSCLMIGKKMMEEAQFKPLKDNKIKKREDSGVLMGTKSISSNVVLKGSIRCIPNYEPTMIIIVAGKKKVLYELNGLINSYNRISDKYKKETSIKNALKNE